MIIRTLAGALVAAMTAAAAHAAPADPTVALFAQNAAVSNAFEVAESKIILEDSQDPTLRMFAAEMISDHDMAQRALAQAGMRAGVPTAFVLDKTHQAKVDDLGLMDGTKLGSTYLADQVAAHAAAAATLAGYATGGSDPALVAYARQTLPAVLHHQRMLEQVTGEPAPL